jgi:UDP-3-O-[3-hydroxymyristoyl] glucosamine N-acyltransferase
MQNFLELLPAGYREAFGVSEIMNPHCLASARATAFTWTKHSGRVCLGLSRQYYEEAAANENVAVIVAPRQAVTGAPSQHKAVIVAERADEFFYTVHNLAIHRHGAYKPAPGSIHPTARVAKTAIIGPEVTLGADCQVGEGVFIDGPVSIGARCAIHPHATIGTDGLFAKTILGKKVDILHFGGVTLGDDSVVHTAANIARSVNFGETTHIGREVRIGLHVNIGHDCSIGDRTDISGLSLIAGRVHIEEDCWIGANTTISNALSIGKNSKIRIGSVVIDDLAAGSDVSGNFAGPHAVNLKQHLATKRK